jgi:hypothetical protein
VLAGVVLAGVVLAGVTTVPDSSAHSGDPPGRARRSGGP